MKYLSHRCRSASTFRAVFGWRFGLAVLLYSQVMACAQSVPNPDRGMADIRALIGAPHCRSSVDCRSIGVGARACGGPQTYLAWSVEVADPQALSAAVARHAAMQRKALEVSGEASTCVVLEDPGAQCDLNTNQCVIGSGGNRSQRTLR